MEKLATIQRIDKLEPIPNADKIEVASVLGWKVVVEKGLHKEGDLVIYVGIDSLLPVKPEYEFLRKSSYKKLEDGSEWFRIKTCKLRGQISQGLCLPSDVFNDCVIGQDVTKILGIKHYEKPVPINLTGQVKGQLPSFIPKTDEERVQNIVELLPELVNVPLYITTKVDGTSMTVYHKDGEVGVCGRALDYREDDNNLYWNVTKQYNLTNKLKEYGKNIAIQGELCGPKIQKNKLQLEKHKLFVFNIWDINNQSYFEYGRLKELVEILKLDMVPLIADTVYEEKNLTIERYLEMAKGNYEDTNNPREGIVIRSIEGRKFSNGNRMSFKVCNNDFLLKYGE